MKKLLLFSVLLLTTLSVFAYETIIIKYPPGDLWVKAYYKKINGESILQYVPKGESKDSWKRTIIIHAYEFPRYQLNVFMATNMEKLLKANPTGKYRYLKYSDNDIIATRCTADYKDIKGQCEFFRVSRAHGGIISMHYINRDKIDFLNNYDLWFDIVKRTVYYNSYYRDDRTLDKAEYFEL